jgi:hypothetical protein
MNKSSRSRSSSSRRGVALVAALSMVTPLAATAMVRTPALAATKPVVSAVSPQRMKPGGLVTLKGSGFGATQGSGYVRLSDASTTWGGPKGVVLHINAWAGTRITFTLPVPSGTSNQWRVVPGTTATVTVTQSGATSKSRKPKVANTDNPADYFGNIGISPDNHPLCGANFDVGNANDAYSANLLRADGIKPGGTVKAGGLTFTWPKPANCYYDNIIAEGQTILLPPNHGATKLGFLGASGNATRGGTLTIHYTDGSTSHSAVSLTDWGTPAEKGNTVVAHMSYRNTNHGHESNGRIGFSIFLDTVALNSAKTVASITLPNTVLTNQSMRIFALALNGTAQ